MSKNIEVIEFQIEYPILNLQLSNFNKEEYSRGVITVYIAELDRGFIVKKINKPTKHGTKVTYKACKTDDECNDYIVSVNDMIDRHNKKFENKIGYKLCRRNGNEI